MVLTLTELPAPDDVSVDGAARLALDAAAAAAAAALASYCAADLDCSSAESLTTTSLFMLSLNFVLPIF